MTALFMRSVALSMAALASLAAPAMAQDCKLTPLGVADLQPVAGGARVSVPVSINGVTKRLLLSTGAGSSSLTRATGAALSLSSSYTPSRLLDSQGYASRHYFAADNVQWGNIRAHHVGLMQTPDPSFGKDEAVDGIFSVDMMRKVDVEMDFAAHKMIYFSQDHCPGAVVHWQASEIGVAPIMLKQREYDMRRGGEIVRQYPGFDPAEQQILDAVEQTQVQGTDIRTVVTIDGHDFVANIDTGAEYSTLNDNAARAVFGVTKDSPGSMPLKPVANTTTGQGETVIVTGSRGFAHGFHTLSFGGVTVASPQFAVVQDRTGRYDSDNKFMAGSRILREDDVLRPEVTIGMDVLKHLHLYFAFGERRLYITSTDAKPEALTARP